MNHAAAAVPRTHWARLQAELQELDAKIATARVEESTRQIASQEAATAVLDAHSQLQHLWSDAEFARAVHELRLARNALSRAQVRMQSATRNKDDAETRAKERIDLPGKEVVLAQAEAASPAIKQDIEALEDERMSVQVILGGSGDGGDLELQAAIQASYFMY